MARVRVPRPYGAPQTTQDQYTANVQFPPTNTGIGGYGGGKPVPPVDTEDYSNSPGNTAGGQHTPPPPPPAFSRTAENNPGLDATKWLSGYVSPKYAWHEIGLQHDLTNDAGRAAALAAAQSQFPEWFGGASWEGDDFLNLGENPNSAWNGVTGFDAIFNASGEGGGTRPWMGNESFAPGYGPQGGSPAGSQAGSQAGGFDLSSMLSLFGDMGQDYGGPQSSGVFPSDNLQQVGQDPFSELITGGLAALIGSGGQGFSEVGDASNDALMRMLESGGGFNEDIINARMESARENAERWRKGQMDTLQAGLADRGLIGSGPERTGMEKIGLEMEGIGATALRDIFADQSGAADERLMQALGMGMGAGQANNRTLLDTLGEGTNRQNVLAQIAMDSLGQNMEWQQFLSTFGLSQDALMNEIQMGRIDRVLELLALFNQQAQIAAGGFV